MPAGATHDRLTLWSLPWIAGASYSLTRSSKLTLLVAGAFLFSGLMFGPDLDIYSVQYKRWGPLRWLWLPYRFLIRHRSLLSHGLLLGTGLRLLYLASLLLLASVLAGAVVRGIWSVDWNWQQVIGGGIQFLGSQYLPEALALWTGLELGAASHSLSDWVASTYKRYQRGNSRVKKRRERGRKNKPKGR